MNDWQIFLLVSQVVVYGLILAFSVELMRRRRHEGRPPDVLVLTYYTGAAGAVLNLADAIKGHVPRPGMLLLAIAVMVYLGIRLFGPAPPDLSHKP